MCSHAFGVQCRLGTHDGQAMAYNKQKKRKNTVYQRIIQYKNEDTSN